jgi:small conductance mechanosensitive channel
MGGGALVVGLALQGTLGNFAAGVMILMYRPYDIGDVVSVSGVTGKVDAMSLVATTLTTPDNQMVVVPNGSIWGGIITNITGTARRRVDLVFGIGYEDDMAKAEAILAEIVEAHEKVLKDPAPVIKVAELADSSVNFICRPWCKTADYWDVYWDLTRQVKEKFDEASISIPYPQTDVHVHTVAAS